MSPDDSRIKDIELLTENRVSPIWRMNRLVEMINRLPSALHAEAKALCKFDELVKIVSEHRGEQLEYALCGAELEAAPF